MWNYSWAISDRPENVDTPNKFALLNNIHHH